MTERGLELAPGDPRYRRACIALLLVGIATLGLMYAPQPLLPTIGADFGLSAAQVSWLISAVALGVAVGVIPLGAASAHWGRGRMILVGLAVTTISGLALGLVPFWWLLVLARFVQGIGIAAVLVSAMAWVVDNVAPHSVTRVGALYIAGTTVGGMGGRLLAGYLTELLGTWQSGLFASAVLLAVFGGIAHLLLPRAVVIRRERIAAAGPDPNARTRHAMYLLALVGMIVHAGIYNAAAFQGAAAYGLGPGSIALLFLAYAAGTVTSALAGRSASRIPVRTLQLGGIAAAATGVAVMFVPQLWALILGLLLLSGGFFAMHALASSTAARLSLQPSAGAARYNLAYYVGTAAGSVAFGALWDTGGWTITTVVALGLLALTAGTAWLFGPRGTSG